MTPPKDEYITRYKLSTYVNINHKTLKKDTLMIGLDKSLDINFIHRCGQIKVPYVHLRASVNTQPSVKMLWVKC